MRTFEANNSSTGKDGKDRKDHVHQSFWYNSNLDSKPFAMISTKDNFDSKNIKILSIDFETRPTADGIGTRNQIFAAGFSSSTGFSESVHIEDDMFGSDEVKFVRYIVYKIQSFQGIITSWYLANSDLVILDEVCKSIGVISPVEFYEVPIQPSNENDDSDSPGNNASSVISYPYLKDKQTE